MQAVASGDHGRFSAAAQREEADPQAPRPGAMEMKHSDPSGQGCSKH